jgi:hypothetical protein
MSREDILQVLADHGPATLRFIRAHAAHQCGGTTFLNMVRDGLLEEQPPTRKDYLTAEKRWRITPKGWAFLKGEDKEYPRGSIPI